MAQICNTRNGLYIFFYFEESGLVLEGFHEIGKTSPTKICLRNFAGENKNLLCILYSARTKAAQKNVLEKYDFRGKNFKALCIVQESVFRKIWKHRIIGTKKSPPPSLNDCLNFITFFLSFSISLETISNQIYDCW